jgi:rSAM/selenodomain-associated transferase 2
MRPAIIIPTLNEEANIARVIRHVRDTAGNRRIEIIVVDGGSEDQTRELARPLADRVLLTPTCGRAAQMHAGALATTAELLVFLHADTLLPDDWTHALERAWSAHPPPAATAFHLGFDRDSRAYQFLAWVGNWRARLSRTPYGDQALAVSRAEYFAVGGFPPVPLMEEYYLLRKLRRRGAVKILPEKVTTSARRFEQNGWFRQTLRIKLLLALFHLGVPLQTLAQYYRNKKGVANL